MAEPTAAPRTIAARVMGLLLVLAGAGLLVGGGLLVAAHGSWAYLPFGLAYVGAGVLVWRGRRSALMLYAALLGAMLLWSLWEVGIDWWPLAARLDVPFVLGALLLLPAVVRSLAGGRGPVATLGGVLAVAAVVALGAGLSETHEMDGELPTAALGAPAAQVAGADIPDGEWHAYGRTGYGQRYSPLAQLTPTNVAGLQEAWRFRTGDLRGRAGDPVETTDEVTPLKVGERLFLCTPHQQALALDATTGKLLWRYDARVKVDDQLALQHLTCRGLGYQPPPASPAGATAAPGECRAKLFLPTADARLIALDPETGTPCRRFGNGTGQIDLSAHMPNLKPGSYYSTSAPVVTKKLVIVGGTVLDNFSTHEESGVIRAFDVETGALVWNWDAGNPDATAPIGDGQTYTANSPNSWSTSSVDEQLGLLYAPIGNQPPDQFGGARSAAVERVSSSVVALDLATGRLRWVFQTVHHDLWDYDVPAQPSLVDLQVGGGRVPALVQPTKQGEVFVLDRRTGQPVVPVDERAAPQGAAAGDHSAPTQPHSRLSFEPAPLTERAMWGATMFDQLACRIAFHRLEYGGRFTPPSERGSLIYPGNFGVFNWGSIAIDPQRQVAFMMPTYLAFTSRLVPRRDDSALVVNQTRPAGALPPLNENFGAPYAAQMGAFLSPLKLPCQAPPWGYVAGADLRSGRVVWRHRNGTVRDLSPIPVPLRMGVPGIGGPIITAGGVAFLSGSMDDYVRAYDLTDGRQLWESRLPAGGQATPMSYTGADGRQFLLVVAGGHGSTGTKPGDYVIAYALPRR